MLAFTIQCRGRKFYCPLLLLPSQFLGNFFTTWLVVFLSNQFLSKADCWFLWRAHYQPLMIRSGQSDPISDLLVLLASFISCHLHCLVFIVFSLLHTPSVESHLITNAKTNKPTRKNYNTSNKWNVQIFWGGLKLVGLFIYIWLQRNKNNYLWMCWPFNDIWIVRFRWDEVLKISVATVFTRCMKSFNLLDFAEVSVVLCIASSPKAQ